MRRQARRRGLAGEEEKQIVAILPGVKDAVRLAAVVAEGNLCGEEDGSEPSPAATQLAAQSPIQEQRGQAGGEPGAKNRVSELDAYCQEKWRQGRILRSISGMLQDVQR